MNKVPIFFLVFLIASMALVTTSNADQVDSQLDILVKITLNTQTHIKSDIDKMNNIPEEAYQQYDKGTKEIDLLIVAVEEGNTASARQHFINAMIAFKKASIATETMQEESQQAMIPDRSQTIKKYETNIKTLKIISSKLKAGINFEQIDQLLGLAKENYTQGNFVQNEKVLSKIASDGREIHKLLYEISEENKILRAKHFAQKHAERIHIMILQAKEIGLYETANKLEESKIQLLQTNSTQIIKQQFKITIIHQQKIAQASEIQQTKLLKYKSVLDSLENKAKRLADDAGENIGANSFLNKAFSLIEETRKDLSDLEYAPTTMRDDSKYFELTIGKNIQTIKDLLAKAERIIYTSS